MKNIVHLCDCMEFMKTLPDNAYDLAIVDPPYGGNDAIGLSDNTGGKKQATKRTEYRLFANIEPSREYWAELKRVAKEHIVWGCNFYKEINLPGGRLIWDKKGTAFGGAEAAYLSMTKSVNIYEFSWNGMIQGDMKNKESRIHPTQKPIALYKWLLQNYAKPGQTIFDSHVGSGSIRIACHDLGFDFEGCEIDPDYHAAQEERYRTHAAQGSLFEPEELRQPVQADLISEGV